MADWKPGSIPGSYETSYSTQPNAMDNLALLAGAMAKGYGDRRAAEQKSRNTLMNTVSQQYAAQGRLTPSGPGGGEGPIPGFDIGPQQPNYGDIKDQRLAEKYKAQTDILKDPKAQMMQNLSGMINLPIAMQIMEGAGVMTKDPKTGKYIIDSEALSAMSEIFSSGGAGGGGLEPSNAGMGDVGVAGGATGGIDYESMSAEELFALKNKGDKQAAMIGRKKYPTFKPKYSSGR